MSHSFYGVVVPRVRHADVDDEVWRAAIVAVLEGIYYSGDGKADGTVGDADWDGMGVDEDTAGSGGGSGGGGGLGDSDYFWDGGGD